VDKEALVRDLDDNTLSKTFGGTNITGTIVNAFVDGIMAIFDVGKSLGFSIRRLSGNNLCPLQ
jgi:hypothetical protein